MLTNMSNLSSWLFTKKSLPLTDTYATISAYVGCMEGAFTLT